MDEILRLRARPAMHPQAVGNDAAAPIALKFDSGSFRDRHSRVFVDDNQVFRTLTAESHSTWQRLCIEPFFRRMMTGQQIIETEELSSDDCRRFDLTTDIVGVLRQEKIAFVSYPYEWCFSMLREAALLHLQIMSEAVPTGLILKDASPYNVQFRGSKPGFIDIGSFTELEPGEPWSAYRQFCELMLFPLLLQAYREVDFQPVLRAELEGISARQFMQWIRWRDLMRPGVFTNGWLHAALEQRAEGFNSSTVRDLQSAGFQKSMIERMLVKLTRLVEHLEWKPTNQHWTRYHDSLLHVAADRQAKAAFVRKVSQTRHRELVWDLGCNDGRYSQIASEWATTVVAMDQDHACVERLYRSLGPTQQKILPLCVNLANASPELGWRGRERKRLEDRGRPDLVICLGLIHHLVIAANIPLPEVVDWLASFGGEVILEFPTKNDVMVTALLRNKRDQYDDYSLERLLTELGRYFEIPFQESLPSGERTLFHAVPKSRRGGAI